MKLKLTLHRRNLHHTVLSAALAPEVTLPLAFAWDGREVRTKRGGYKGKGGGRARLKGTRGPGLPRIPFTWAWKLPGPE